MFCISSCGAWSRQSNKSNCFLHLPARLSFPQRLESLFFTPNPSPRWNCLLFTVRPKPPSPGRLDCNGWTKRFPPLTTPQKFLIPLQPVMSSNLGNWLKWLSRIALTGVSSETKLMRTGYCLPVPRDTSSDATIKVIMISPPALFVLHEANWTDVQIAIDFEQSIVARVSNQLESVSV